MCAYGRLRPVYGAPIDIEANYFSQGCTSSIGLKGCCREGFAATLVRSNIEKIERQRMNSPKSRQALQSGIHQRRGISIIVCALFLLPAFVCIPGCVKTVPTTKEVAAPTITAFTASPASIIAGNSTTVNW